MKTYHQNIPCHLSIQYALLYILRDRSYSGQHRRKICSSPEHILYMPLRSEDPRTQVHNVLYSDKK